MNSTNTLSLPNEEKEAGIGGLEVSNTIPAAPPEFKSFVPSTGSKCTHRTLRLAGFWNANPCQ